MLLEVALLQAQLVAQEGLQELLGAVHPLGAVGPDQDHEAPGHPQALGGEALAVLGRHVLQGVEGRHRVEGVVLEGQGEAAAQHQARLVRGLDVDQGDARSLEEAAQERRAPAHVEHLQGRPLPRQPHQEVGDEAIALVLIEGEPFDLAAQEPDSRVSSPPAVRRLTVQVDGRETMPCWLWVASTTSKVSTCSRWSMAVGAALLWS